MIIFWIIVFIASLGALIKGADWLLASAEKIGFAFGLSAFVVGVIIVGVGTSLPELISSLAAVYKGVPEIVASNAVGSNIANILLILGISSIVAKKLEVTKNLIDLEIPILAISTVIFWGVAYDGFVSLGESILLVVTYGIYLLYTMYHKEEETEPEQTIERPKIVTRDIVMLCVGLLALVLGANYLVDSVIELATIFNVAVGAITITAVAVGTSLPELLVSVKAALKGKSEVAIGNIFGSNAFNIMMVVGIPGLFARLPLDGPTLTIGLPALIASTFLLVISGISRKIYSWEGAFFLSLYVLFVAKLFNLF